MKITIKYYKSSSKYYTTICEKSQIFDNYTQEKSENIIVLDVVEIRSKILQLKNVLFTIKNWSKTKYFIDEEEVTFYHIENIVNVLACEKDCGHCALGIEEHCYGNSGWGCNYLADISLRSESYYSQHSDLCWYDFGKFKDGKWCIDKEKIYNQLMREADEKHLTLCTNFSSERVRKNVDMLLDCIEVNESSSWEYRYRDAPLGMIQSEIIGVKPKRESNFLNHFSISSVMGGASSNEADETLLQKNIPSVTFKDIGGIDDIVQRVREVIELPLIVPQLFEYYSIRPHKGVLLYGPPGCGKTLIAKAVANEINAHFISVNGPEILNKYVGQSEENLRSIFGEASKYSPSIIYFDEFDSIATTRDAENNPCVAGIVNQLLTLIDGIKSTNQVCCIASTNRIDMIDSAIKRPGRFDYVIEIQKPNLEGCKAIFRIHTEKMPVAAKFNKERFVEKYLEGYTGAEIAFIASEAAYNSIRRTIDIPRLFLHPEECKIQDYNVIEEMDFIKAVNTLKESKQKTATSKYRYLSNQYI